MQERNRWGVFLVKTKANKMENTNSYKTVKKRPSHVTICSDIMRSSSCHLTRAPSQTNKRCTPRSRARPFAVSAARQTFSRLPSRCHKLRRERHESPVTLFRCGAPRFHLSSRRLWHAALPDLSKWNSSQQRRPLECTRCKRWEDDAWGLLLQVPPTRPHPTPPYHRPHSHTHTPTLHVNKKTRRLHLLHRLVSP